MYMKIAFHELCIYCPLLCMNALSPCTLTPLDKLSQLIKACEDSGVKFVYAIAPGLDIVFSSEREVEALKMKLDQVRGG